MSVTLNTTHGKLKFELYCEQTPMSVKNFLALAASNYYDGTVFHRNIKGFILQGGDPSGTGKGGASIYGKTFKDEIIPEVKHDKRGTLSMASSGPNTNGSQFFVTYGKQSHLDGQYTIFGKLIDGFESLDLMEKEPVDAKERPLNEIKLYSVTVHSNPIADKEQS